MEITREAIRTKFAQLSSDSIQLAWALAPLYGLEGEKQLLDWGFGSFGAWIAEDICNAKDPSRYYVSRSYAYELAKTGRFFLPYKTRIDVLAKQNQMGVRRLIDLHDKFEQGTPLELIERHIELGEPLPEEEESKRKSTDPEMLIPFDILVKKGDLKNFQTTLFLYAVTSGYQSIDNACSDIVLSLMPELKQKNLGSYEKYRDIILEGEFFCKKCKRIPLDATTHHVVPKSIVHGYGPQVVLCVRCHDRVQLYWRRYARLWGWEPDTIINEYNDLVRSGEPIINPYPIVENDSVETSSTDPVEEGYQVQERASGARTIPQETGY